MLLSSSLPDPPTGLVGGGIGNGGIISPTSAAYPPSPAPSNSTTIDSDAAAAAAMTKVAWTSPGHKVTRNSLYVVLFDIAPGQFHWNLYLAAPDDRTGTQFRITRTGPSSSSNGHSSLSCTATSNAKFSYSYSSSSSSSTSSSPTSRPQSPSSPSASSSSSSLPGPFSSAWDDSQVLSGNGIGRSSSGSRKATPRWRSERRTQLTGDLIAEPGLRLLLDIGSLDADMHEHLAGRVAQVPIDDSDHRLAVAAAAVAASAAAAAAASDSAPTALEGTRRDGTCPEEETSAATAATMPASSTATIEAATPSPGIGDDSHVERCWMKEVLTQLDDEGWIALRQSAADVIREAQDVALFNTGKTYHNGPVERSNLLG